MLFRKVMQIRTKRESKLENETKSENKKPMGETKSQRDRTKYMKTQQHDITKKINCYKKV